MLELCRKYWDDPEYRKKLKREIEEGKAKRASQLLRSNHGDAR